MAKQINEAEATQKAKVMKEEAIQQAVMMYQDRLEGPESSRLGLWTVCGMVEKAVKEESGIEVKITYGTVRARFNGVYNIFGPSTDLNAHDRNLASHRV